MIFNKITIPPAVLLLSCISLSGQNPPEQVYSCRQTETAIRLDGKGEDPAWRHAMEIPNFFTPRSKKTEAEKATTGTRAKLLWDARYLYYFAEMEDGDLKAERKARDDQLWLDDVFELFFKPSPENTGYYEFQATPLGTLLDIFYPERTPDRYNENKNKGKFGHAAKVVVNGTLNNSDDKDTGWQVEGRIPWSDFKALGGGPKLGDQWRFMLCRYDYDPRFENRNQAELTVSSPLMTRDFHNYEDFAPIKFEGVYNPRTGLPAHLQKVGPVKTNLVGSPEPPPPYKAEAAPGFAPISRLIDFQFEPGTGQMIYVDQPPGIQGSRLVRLLDRKKNETKVLLEFPNETMYSIEFHPDYEKNGHIFASHFGPKKGEREDRRVQVKRFVMKRDGSGELESDQGEIIIQWKTWGHTGGAMAFDDDGIFYVTTGDGTGDSDTELSGQDLSRPLAKVLRIDVDNPADGKAYSVPKDNPFLDLEGACPETFAYGLRNPWRMVWDKKLKRLWVGNNGQDRYEQVYLVERGANYGWSVYEGGHVFYAERKRGPHPVSPPTLEHDHGESRSLTGGMVYSGDVLPDLKSAYIYGDHSTGKIWAARHDGEKVTWSAEIADTTLGISQFNNDPKTGDLLVAHHGPERDGGGLYRLIPNPADPNAPPFPKKLSETGLFKNVKTHQVREEFLGYDVNVPQWVDGAECDRYFGLSPEARTIRFGGNRGWNLPDGAVAFQTLSRDGRRLETRVMIKQDKEWGGYSYAWNESQTDAELVPAEGGEIALGEGKIWPIPSRVDCMNCHSRATNFLLGLETSQMNRDRDYGDGFVANQIGVMDDLGLFLQASAKKRSTTLRGTPQTLPKLADPFDEKNPDINARARALLHARCSGCHREAGGGNAMIHLQHFSKPDKFGVINVAPNHGDQGLEGGDIKIVKPGDPSRSVMFHRVTKTGPGKMPPIGSQTPDPKVGAILLRWILEMKEEDSPEED